jgi:hypothetical protein
MYLYLNVQEDQLDPDNLFVRENLLDLVFQERLENEYQNEIIHFNDLVHYLGNLDYHVHL